MKPDLLESIQQAPTFLTAELSAPAEKASRVRDVLFYSGAKVERYDFWADEFYDLSFSLDGADLSELDGAPVLNGHSRGSVFDVVGTVLSPRREATGYAASLSISEADDVEPIWQRIEDGTLKSVSMGVRIGKLKLVEDDKKAKRKHYMAESWKPFEISLVAIGADPGAKFLSMDPRFEKLRAEQFSVDSGAAKVTDEAVERARYELAIRRIKYRALGR